jgi:hypothetical protein
MCHREANLGPDPILTADTNNNPIYKMAKTKKMFD